MYYFAQPRFFKIKFDHCWFVFVYVSKFLCFKEERFCF
jgi:hypothetical protein